MSLIRATCPPVSRRRIGVCRANAKPENKTKNIRGNKKYLFISTSCLILFIRRDGYEIRWGRYGICPYVSRPHVQTICCKKNNFFSSSGQTQLLSWPGPKPRLICLCSNKYTSGANTTSKGCNQKSFLLPSKT